MFKKLFIFLFLSSLSISSFAQDSENSQKNLFSFFFNEALKNRLQGDYNKSVEMYINCLKIDDTSAAVPYEIAKILYGSNDLENANKFINMALANDNDSNKFYIELAVDIKVALQKYNELLPLVDKLIKSEPYDVQAYLLASKIATEIKKYDLAINYLESVPDAELYEDYILPSKYDILMKSGKQKKAYKLIYQKYKKNPKSAKYNFYMSDYSFRTLKNQDGIGYLKIATECPDGDIYNFDMANIMLKLNYIESFKVYSMAGFSSPNISSDVKFNKLVSSLQSKDVPLSDADKHLFYTAAFDTLIAQYPDNEQFYLLYAEFCSAENNINKSIMLYEKLHSISSLSSEAWRDFLFKLSYVERYDDVLTYSTEALLTYPDEPILLLLQGDSYVIKEQYANAIKPLKHSYSLLSSISNSNVNNLKVSVMNALATAYFYTDSASSAYAYFEEILNIDQYDVSALNNYSYYLSLKKENLDYAEQMARKANDIRPGNPTFLDTYAWVLYQKKNYSEALFIIERAIDLINKDKNNSEIYDHYGDILYMNNNAEKAIDYWRKSYESKKSDIIKMKIDAGKIVEK